MDFFQAFILSVVEGITEFLPISSTGHLIIASKLLNIPQTEFAKTFEIVIQSGAILAVIFLYKRRLLQDKELLKKTIWAFIPTAIIGFLLYKLIKNFLIGNLQITLIALALGGIIIILAENYFKKQEGNLKIRDLTTLQAVYVGLFQSISVIPGVSRSAATILGGMFLGLTREAAVEFSFMLAIPTMIAATGYDLLKSVGSFDSSQIAVLAVGVVVSFIVAVLAIKWFLGFIKSNNLIPFGIYRIIVATIFLFLVK